MNQVSQETWEDHLGFVQYKVIDLWKLFVFHDEELPTRNYFYANLIASSNQRLDCIALYDQGVNENVVSLGRILRGQICYVQINQSLLSIIR